MKQITWALSIGLLGFALACCGGGGAGGSHSDHDFSSKSSVDIGTKLASVDGMEIGTNDFDRQAKRLRPRDTGEIDDEFKQEVMDELVNEGLLYQEALRQGIDRDPKIRKMMVNTLLKRDVYGTLDPNEITDEELQTYFDEHKDEFVVPEKVQIKRILIKVSDKMTAEDAAAKAGELRDQIEANPSQFKSVAQQHSKGPYARRGGDLGFVGRKGKPGIDQALIDAAFEMDKGEVSQVIETKDGYNILLVPNRRERVERTFEQMRGSVLRKVKSDRYNELYEDYVLRLKDAATIEVDSAALTAYEYSAVEATGPMTNPVRLTPSSEQSATDTLPKPKETAPATTGTGAE